MNAVALTESTNDVCTPAARDPSLSAATKFFNIYELVEMTFKDFAARDLLRLQRVNRMTHAVVWDSPASKHTLHVTRAAPQQRLPSSKPEPPPLNLTPKPVPPNEPYISPRRPKERFKTPRIFFANKTQARAVLVHGRQKYSWERMFSAFPTPKAFQACYLAEEDIAIKSGDQELTWITQKTVRVSADELTLGKMLTLAARVVVEDNQALDPEEPMLAQDNINVSAATYLRFFPQNVTADAELDYQETTYPEDKVGLSLLKERMLIPRTWPWAPKLQSIVKQVESEWLRDTDGLEQLQLGRPPTDPHSPHLQPLWAERLKFEESALSKGDEARVVRRKGRNLFR